MCMLWEPRISKEMSLITLRNGRAENKPNKIKTNSREPVLITSISATCSPFVAHKIGQFDVGCQVKVYNNCWPFHFGVGKSGDKHQGQIPHRKFWRPGHYTSQCWMCADLLEYMVTLGRRSGTPQYFVGERGDLREEWALHPKWPPGYFSRHWRRMKWTPAYW